RQDVLVRATAVTLIEVTEKFRVQHVGPCRKTGVGQRDALKNERGKNLERQFLVRRHGRQQSGDLWRQDVDGQLGLFGRWLRDWRLDTGPRIRTGAGSNASLRPGRFTRANAGRNDHGATSVSRLGMTSCRDARPSYTNR